MSPHRATLASLLAASLTLAAIGQDGSADTWPQWHGPSRDGQCVGPTWPAGLQEDHLKLTWHVGGLGPSYAGPIVTDDRVFSVETLDETWETVRAYDRATGAELWSAKWEGSMKVPFFAAKNGSWVRSTPAYDGTRLYVGGMQDVIACLDAKTGERVWTVDCKERYGSADPSFGLVCSPLIVGGDLYVQAGGGLLKLDRATGETIWRALEGGAGMDSAFSSPVMATIHDREQLVVQTRTDLCGVDPVNGDVLWTQKIKSFRGMNILTPTIVGNAVFTAPYGGRTQMLAIERDGDSFSVRKVWDNRIQGYMTSPVVIDGHAYFFTKSNRFTCINLESGEEKWTSGPTGDSYWSIVAQGDRILALNDTGRLRLIKASPEAYEVIDEIPVAEDQTWAHVAVVGQDIFIREQSGLTAFRWQ